MGLMDVGFERQTEEAQLAMTCACGSCHPTATTYRDDPDYEWHESRLAEGPCCCGRFFVIGHDVATLEGAPKPWHSDSRAKARRLKGMISKPTSTSSVGWPNSDHLCQHKGVAPTRFMEDSQLCKS